MNYPVIILGSGGHAKVLIETLRHSSTRILFITDTDPAKKGQSIMDIPIVGGDEEVMTIPPDLVLLVNGVGSVRVNPVRRKLFERFKSRGYKFASVIHPSSIIASDVAMGEGVQIMAGAVVQTGSIIGINSIINTHAIVDHDCHIGDHTHIAPGAILSGSVRVGENAHIGAGATVLQETIIGKNCLIAAGAVVIDHVSEALTVAGVPAKQIRNDK